VTLQAAPTDDPALDCHAHREQYVMALREPAGGGVLFVSGAMPFRVDRATAAAFAAAVRALANRKPPPQGAADKPLGAMPPKGTCEACSYWRKPAGRGRRRYVCRCAESPHANLITGAAETCDQFARDPKKVGPGRKEKAV